MFPASVLAATVVSLNRATGDCMVLASRAGLAVPMIRVGGVWKVGTFSPDELKDSFERVKDPEEASTFLQAAIAAASAL